VSSWLHVARVVAVGAYEIAAELWHEHRRTRARKRAADEWARTPAQIKGCPRCNEIAYLPGQVACNRCGAILR
jgi:uncharacterized paraquat-inducible protein A